MLFSFSVFFFLIMIINWQYVYVYFGMSNSVASEKQCNIEVSNK